MVSEDDVDSGRLLSRHADQIGRLVRRLVAAGTAGGSAIGAFVMNWKAGAAATVLLAVTATVWHVVADRRVTPLPEANLERRDMEVSQPPIAPLLQSRIESSRSQEPTPRENAAIARSEATEPGRLRFAVVDAATSQPLVPVTVRAMSETRFAEIQGGVALEAILTAGAYDVLVSARGYERVLRRAVAIESGAVSDLGTIALDRGTASIAGRVRSPSLAPDARRYVELRGEGRSPCPRCATARMRPDPRPLEELNALESIGPRSGGQWTREEAETLLRKQLEASTPLSSCCGYGTDRSFIQADAGGHFEFSGLAAGTYFLRAHDARLRVLWTTRLEIGPGESRVVDLSLEPEASLQVELRDETGRPFVGKWKNDWSEATALIHISLDVDGVLIPFDLPTSAADVRARFGPPPRLGGPPDPDRATAPQSVDVDEIPAFDCPEIGISVPCADRRRRESDRLIPTAPTPAFTSAEYGLVRPRVGCLTLLHMPASRVRISASCCGETSQELELNLAEPSQRTAKLVLMTK